MRHNKTNILLANVKYNITQIIVSYIFLSIYCNSVILKHTMIVVNMLHLLIASNVWVGVRGMTLDWSAYIEYDTYMNWNKSNNLIMQLPVYQYWDSGRADYEVGVLSDELKNIEIYQEFVSIIDKQTFVNGVVNVKKNVAVTDIDSLLMHMVASIQNLNLNVTEYELWIEQLIKEKDDFALKIIRIAEETGKEWRTASEIRAMRHNVDLKIKTIEMLLQKEANRKIWKTANRVLKFNKKKEILRDHNITMSLLKEEEVSTLASEQINKTKALHELYESSILLDYELDIYDIESEHNASVALLNHSSTIELDAMLFRIQQETRSERENELLFVNLTLAKAKSSEMQIKMVIETIFQELMIYGSMATENPVTVLTWSGAICGVLILLTVVSEVLIIAKFYILNRLYNKKYQMVTSNANKTHAPLSAQASNDKEKKPSLNEIRISDSKDVFVNKTNKLDADPSCTTRSDIKPGLCTSERLHDVVLSSTSYAQFKQYLTYFDVVGFNDTKQNGELCLPNALLSGPSGTGKSHSIAVLKSILHTNNQHYTQCSYQVIIISGADLLALGPEEASNYLRELYIQHEKEQKKVITPKDGKDKNVLEQTENKYYKMVVIIDEADSMIVNRSRSAMLSNSLNTSNTDVAVKNSNTAGETNSSVIKKTNKSNKSKNKQNMRTDSEKDEEKFKNSMGVSDATTIMSANIQSSTDTDPDATDAGVESDSSCFYQILCACRVNNPNICIFLTTNHSVPNIDRSVLDRMDMIIEYEYPTAVLCARYLLQCTWELLYSYLPSNSIATTSAPNVENIELHKSRQLLISSIQYDEQCYQQSHLPSLSNSCTTTGMNWKEYKDQLLDMNEKMKLHNDDFNIVHCIIYVIDHIQHTQNTIESKKSEKRASKVDEIHVLWSYREILKFIRNIQCEVLGTEG